MKSSLFRSSNVWIFAGIALIAPVLILTAYLLTPSFFIQAGQHYVVGLDLFRVSVHTCTPSDEIEDCDRQGLLAAVASDPNPGNWFPIKSEFIRP